MYYRPCEQDIFICKIKSTNSFIIVALASIYLFLLHNNDKLSNWIYMITKQLSKSLEPIIVEGRAVVANAWAQAKCNNHFEPWFLVCPIKRSDKVKIFKIWMKKWSSSHGKYFFQKLKFTTVSISIKSNINESTIPITYPFDDAKIKFVKNNASTSVVYLFFIELMLI